MDCGNGELTRLSDLIGLIYEGATDPGRWTKDILPAVAEYIEAPACILYSPLHTPPNGGYFFLHGTTQNHVDQYVHKYYDEDLWKIALNEKALDRLPSGILMLDGSGAVAFANRSAQRMLEDGDGLRLRKLTHAAGLGDLVAENAAASKAINDAISATLKRDPYATPHFSMSVTVPRASGLASYTLQFSALGDHSEFGGKSGAFAAIIFIADGAQKMEIDPASLQDAYGLTPAEARVAVTLLEAGSAQEVAEVLEISPNTVNTHIKRIYAKLGVDTRARFVKLLLGLATPHS